LEASAPKLVPAPKMSIPFCQDFSKNFGYPKRFDRKFRGEILKIERGNLEDFSLKFAVKLWGIYKPLKFSGLQSQRGNGLFCQDFS
jgi:hypothetical protein